MRILHTSDLHLGRTLHGTDLSDAQAAALQFIADVAQEHDVDAVVVAGDVYDRAVPSVDAVRLLHQFLARVCPQRTVIVTSGNHDSATRLGFGAELFKDSLHVRAAMTDVGDPVVLHDEHGPVAFFAIPYLEPDVARRAFAADPDTPLPRSHEAVMRHAMDRVREGGEVVGLTRRVVIAHGFVVGAGRGEPGRADGASGEDQPMRSESERDITVGGIDAIPADVFAGVSYVAMGHLHGPQTVAGPAGTVVAYSGSPVRYSFSEAQQEKSVTIVDIDGDGIVSTHRIPVPQPRGMARVAGRFAELVAVDGPSAEHADDWVHITVTDPVRPDEMGTQLRSRFPNALVISHEPVGATRGGLAHRAVEDMTPRDVIAAFITELGGQPPTEAEMAVVDEALADVLVGEG